MAQLISALKRTERSIYSRAALLGVKRSEQYLQSEHACRLRKDSNSGAATRYRAGQKPWNTGMKGWDAGGKSALTRFARGNVPHTWVPVGTERITADGILQRKTHDDGPPHKRWRSVHMMIWEEAYGAVPSGHIVVFKDRNRRNVELDNLELITRAENCRRNSIHRYPPELKQIIRLHKKLGRAIRDAENEKQND